jgi:hypothetical protein
MNYLDFLVVLDGLFSSERYAISVCPQICNFRFPVISTTIILH